MLKSYVKQASVLMVLTALMAGGELRKPAAATGSSAPASATEVQGASALPKERSMHDPYYRQVIRRTAGMVGDEEVVRLATRHGLAVMNVTWEDTGRYKGSSVGPNISDMTIQVQSRDERSGQYTLSLMPVIRHPNFSDKTADLPLDRFYLLVGNEQEGKPLTRVSLRQLLTNPRQYMSTPESWKGSALSLLAPRDTHVLVSAQACFLPIPREGSAQFNPVLFNYQSYRNNPAVMTILVTRQGTSMTIIDNVRDRFDAGDTWGQRLFFNKAGERASLTGTRMSDFLAAGGDEPTATTPAPSVSGREGLNMVMVIQVPLKFKEPPRRSVSLMDGIVYSAVPETAMAAEHPSDVEEAVIGHGEVEGPFTEFDNLAIERDPRFPIRVTVQFYKATSNGVVSESDMAEIAEQIDRVYRDADYVGSLVTDGMTDRPTEYEGDKQKPADWWPEFYRRQLEEGRTPEELRALQRRLGMNPGPLPEPADDRGPEQPQSDGDDTAADPK